VDIAKTTIMVDIIDRFVAKQIADACGTYSEFSP